MRKMGFIVKKMGEDGACLFRAVADQVYGDQEMHGVVRKHCMDYIVSIENKDCMKVNVSFVTCNLSGFQSRIFLSLRSGRF